ncbi:hypothetical protein, partial [Hoylesella timonensis]|uniref:hypothetical protein n=1 Tax=Hoylesella timonensis TaxID=386414 RepID=UPI00242D2953
KKRIFLSWNFNERQRSTNYTNLVGYFSQRNYFFLQRIKRKKRIFQPYKFVFFVSFVVKIKTYGAVFMVTENAAFVL